MIHRCNLLDTGGLVPVNLDRDIEDAPTAVFDHELVTAVSWFFFSEFTPKRRMKIKPYLFNQFLQALLVSIFEFNKCFPLMAIAVNSIFKLMPISNRKS